jgi:hypothetical protein
MAKPKLKLADLQVESIVTTLQPQEMQSVKGGLFVINGNRFRYRARWTSVDTRAETPGISPTNANSGL